MKHKLSPAGNKVLINKAEKVVDLAGEMGKGKFQNRLPALEEIG
ncbi:MAG: hypothetical protein AOA65_2199 [Candidatus Bathyarchaeota archaeon BA1]|nr:MAG: hypothetical protein AOA65_2199 [Candidatus Bathyarchaeota archaeon BA1]